MNARTLSDLLDRELRYLHCVESQLFGTLAELTQRTGSPALREHLERKRAVTIWQRERLRMVPRALGLELAGEACPGVDALLDEILETAGPVDDDETRDAVLIAGLRRIGSVERSAYESALRHAELLREPLAADLFSRNLIEEIEAEEELDELERSLDVDRSVSGDELRRTA